jgi:predicted nucleotidyltransferase
MLYQLLCSPPLRFSRCEADEFSNADMIVESERPVGLRFVELADHLEELMGRDADLLTPAGIQAIRSQRVAESIRQGVVYV